MTPDLATLKAKADSAWAHAKHVSATNTTDSEREIAWLAWESAQETYDDAKDGKESVAECAVIGCFAPMSRTLALPVIGEPMLIALCMTHLDQCETVIVNIYSYEGEKQ